MIVVHKKPDPLHPDKQQLHLVLDYWLLNRSIDTMHNGNKVISYYSLLNITGLLARLHNCKISSSLDLRSEYHHIGLIPEAKPKNNFCNHQWKMALELTPFGICSLPDVFCYLLSQVLTCLDFCLKYLADILIYSTSWKELQLLETVFIHLQEVNLKIKLSKYQVFKQHLH